MNASMYGTCRSCGEPIVRVESPLDGIWRWRHEIVGVIRTHVAEPTEQGENR